MNMDNDTSSGKSISINGQTATCRCAECHETWPVVVQYDSETGTWYYSDGDGAELCPACKAEGTPVED